MADRRKKYRSGTAALEVALMSPWIFLLFLAVFSFGFFMYAGMSVANAARAAALEMGRRNANSMDQTLACSIVKEELKYLPNATSFPPTCNTLPLLVTVGDGAGNPVRGKNPDGSTNNALLAAHVSVTYRSIQLFPLPYMIGQLTLRRQAEMRVYE